MSVQFTAENPEGMYNLLSGSFLLSETPALVTSALVTSALVTSSFAFVEAAAAADITKN